MNDGWRVVVAGDWHSIVHEEPVFDAFRSLGHRPLRFAWHEYFSRCREGAAWPRRARSAWGRLQNKYLLGPRFAALNRDLVALVREQQPDLLFVYRGTHVTSATLRAVRAAAPGIVLVAYNNDDPLAPGHPRYAWRHFLGALPEYDLALAYRHRNLDDFRRAGARRVELLRSWYVPWLHRPVALSPAEGDRYGCDVVFIGHHEADGRVRALESLAEAGLRVRLFGAWGGYGRYGWKSALAGSNTLRPLAPTVPVWGEEYVKALCGAKIALTFLSKLNRDTYTRRSFEIPATGTFLLSEHTQDLASLFVEGVEAEFFRSPGELVDKARFYLRHPSSLQAVARAGARRVAADGHDVVSRMAQVIAWTKEMRP